MQSEREEDLDGTGDQQIDAEQRSRDDDGMLGQNVNQDAQGQ